MSIFTSKNVWKFLIKIQLTKSNPKIIKGINPPCLMPIRIMTNMYLAHQARPNQDFYHLPMDVTFIVMIWEYHLPKKQLPIYQLSDF